MYVGIRQTTDGKFVLTDPLAANGVTVKLPPEQVAQMAIHPDSYQTKMRVLYNRPPGVVMGMVYTFLTENALWHIHGVVATSALILAFFLQTESAIILGTAAVVSLWALFKRIRKYKRFGAALLSISLLYTTLYFLLNTDHIVSGITSLSLSLISAILVREWKEKNNTKA